MLRYVLNQLDSGNSDYKPCYEKNNGPEKSCPINKSHIIIKSFTNTYSGTGLWGGTALRALGQLEAHVVIHDGIKQLFPQYLYTIVLRQFQQIHACSGARKAGSHCTSSRFKLVF